MNNGLKDYEITDIVYSQFRDTAQVEVVEEVMLLNVGGQVSRATLTQVLQRLKELNPKVIGLDIELNGQKEPTTDSLLRNAIDSLPNLVLAGSLYRSGKEELLHFSSDSFFCKNQPVGYINFVAEDLKAVRFFSPYEITQNDLVRAFAVEIARLYCYESVLHLFQRKNRLERIYYTGYQKKNFLKIDTTHLFDPVWLEAARADGFLHNKIVLIGYIGNHEAGEVELDRLFTPLNEHYTGKAHPDMYGAEIHANIITMILKNRYVFEFPKWVAEFLIWIFCYLNVLLFYWIHDNINKAFHGIIRLIQVLEFILVFLLVAALFYYFHIQVEFFRGITAMILAFDFILIYESLLRERFKFLQQL